MAETKNMNRNNNIRIVLASAAGYVLATILVTTVFFLLSSPDWALAHTLPDLSAKKVNPAFKVSPCMAATEPFALATPDSTDFEKDYVAFRAWQPPQFLTNELADWQAGLVDQIMPTRLFSEQLVQQQFRKKPNTTGMAIHNYFRNQAERWLKELMPRAHVYSAQIIEHLGSGISPGWHTDSGNAPVSQNEATRLRNVTVIFQMWGAGTLIAPASRISVSTMKQLKAHEVPVAGGHFQPALEIQIKDGRGTGSLVAKIRKSDILQTQAGMMTLLLGHSLAHDNLTFDRDDITNPLIAGVIHSSPPQSRTQSRGLIVVNLLTWLP